MLSQYYHTLKHLKLIQIYGQIIFRYKKPAINLNSSPDRRDAIYPWTAAILKAEQVHIPEKLTFLNQEKVITADSIWADKNIDKLWLYNLHYFDFIHSSTMNAECGRTLIARWIKENPPGIGCGWEPYPISLRIVNWIKWILAGNKPSAEMLHSLAVQTRYLAKRIEIHLLANHILANAKALLFAGLFFTAAEGKKWLAKGKKLFTQQLREQILTDGGHFELSPMYHSIILEDMLDVMNLFQTYGQIISDDWQKIIEKMFFWLRNLCHPDGEIAFFNDAALDIASSLSELENYATRLKIALPFSPAKDLHYFSASGFCRMQKNNILLLADVGNIGAAYQPGHAHADTLSFELSLGSKRLIVNSGTSCYAVSAERLRQRSSEAHNTVTIDKQNSSEIWKSFRVARRAKTQVAKFSAEENMLNLTAAHDGYKRLGNCYHTRSWQLTANQLIVEDTISGAGNHHIALIFHFHHDITLEKQQRIIFLRDKNNIILAHIQSNVDLEIMNSTYHPEFNLSIANKKIVATLYQSLPMKLITLFEFKA